jgi:hypothetical protein
MLKSNFECRIVQKNRAAVRRTTALAARRRRLVGMDDEPFVGELLCRIHKLRADRAAEN